MEIFIVALAIIIAIYFYKNRQTNGSSDKDFTFTVKNLNKDETNKVKEGASVNFWQKPNSNTVLIYRSGTMGGVGRIGIVPNKYSGQIIRDLKNKRPYVGQILSLSRSEVRIRYKRPSSKRMKKIQSDYDKKRNSDLEQLLSQDYNPTKGFHVSVDFKKDKTFKIGEVLEIKFQDRDHYIKKSQALGLNFYNQKAELVATKNNQPDKIRRILRAHFNNYKIKTEISSIKALDKYELKYYDRIPGSVIIDFEKDA